MKTIGIIGGMGPLATIDIFEKIVNNTPVKKDSDHIPILIANIPQIPDRTKAILDGGISPVPAIVESGKKLEREGADFLIIPCNTSHYYIDEIQRHFSIPVINMISLTVEKTVSLGIKKVAVLGTEGTLKTGIYQKRLNDAGIECVVPEAKDYAIMQDAIYNIVKAGDFKKDISSFRDMLERYSNEGAEALILGCTELPVLFEKYDNLNYKVIDPTEILAIESVKRAL